MSTVRVRTKFSQKASDRLKSLANEIQERLDEIETIVVELRGAPLDAGTRVKFVPKKPPAKTFGDHPILIEILDMPDGTTCCAVWTGGDAGAELICPCH